VWPKALEYKRLLIDLLCFAFRITPSRNSLLGPTSPYENISPTGQIIGPGGRKQRAPSPPPGNHPVRPAPRPPPSNYATIGPDDGMFLLSITTV
jgi:hypothetical protein